MTQLAATIDDGDNGPRHSPMSAHDNQLDPDPWHRTCAKYQKLKPKYLHNKNLRDILS